MDGKFTKEVVDFADQEVKPREEPTRTDVEIIKYLAHKGLFSKESRTQLSSLLADTHF